MSMDKLAEIMAAKAREIENRVRTVSERELSAFADASAGKPSFAKALQHENKLAVIAEIKRRSPSAGAIAADANAVEQALRYAEGGADCLSILTDKDYFGGSLEDLESAVQSLAACPCPLPCLRKDFMLHPIQVVEAAQAGARAILIIVRALDWDTIRRLYDAASIAGLDSLFEIHEERELEVAVNAGAKIIGVNNRDLKRFRTDLAISEALIPQIPAECIKISESGISTAADAARARACGANAILVGESLMRASNPAQLIQSLQQAGARAGF
jgi:indole-3-glycerol phosphate synthase